VGCGGDGAEQGAPGGGMPPAPVEVLKAAQADVPVDFEYVGLVEGSREVEVRARVTGIIDQRLFEEGVRVVAGQSLFSLDAAPFRAQVAAAEAGLAQAQARVKQAEREYNRLKPLAAANATPQRELDNALSSLDAARADVQAAEARLTQARIDLGYTDVAAPIAGMVGRALKVEGALVNASGDSLLTTIAQVDPIYVRFGVAESEHLRIKRELAAGTLQIKGGHFDVQLMAADGVPMPVTGKLNFQDYKADPATGSFAMRATFPNADSQLAPGQFVRVRLIGAQRPQVIALPQRAVLDGPQGKFVYLIGKGQGGATVAEPRPVQVGEWVRSEGNERNTWIIRGGLNVGDEVIVDGTARIFFPGAPVMVGAPGAAPTAEGKAQ
jgi:membrane fusion protein, multidrug efflux system